MKQVPTATTVFFAVQKDGQTLRDEVYRSETDAWLAALNEGAGAVRFARDKRGCMQLEEFGKPVYFGCSLKPNDAEARAQVMAECTSYLDRNHSQYHVSVVRVTYDAAGRATDVDGDTDDDLCQFYTDAVAGGVWINSL